MQHHQTQIGQFPQLGDGRDAIHVPIIPIEAGEDLRVGQHVRVVDGKAYALLGAVSRPEDTAVGIVDPFLLRPSVPRGKVFWLLLYPGSITSLAHVWTHPRI